MTTSKYARPKSLWAQDAGQGTDAVSSRQQELEDQEAMIVADLSQGEFGRARAMLDVVRNFWFAHDYGPRWLQLDGHLKRIDKPYPAPKPETWTTGDILKSEG